MNSPRDFSTISPSAKALLLVKAQTALPFARRAAELLWGHEAVAAAEREAGGNAAAERRREHFEVRARSIDAALEELGATRILEVASGLSFRGLSMAERAGVFYADTDLPAMVEMKTGLLPELHPEPLAGTLTLESLDALDADAFRAFVRRIPAGPLAIVHEGLLMYLDEPEKARLAASVREALLDRGGAWVTADVYVRSEVPVFREERTRKFLDAHRVEENKFGSFEEAEGFFVAQGFALARRVAPPDPWNVRQTWVLLPA